MSTCPIYIIDDDGPVLQSMKFLLDALGHVCSTFQEPEAFLDQLDALKPGCIITDLRMPNMSGFELRQSLLSYGVDWPMFLMSADCDSATAENAKSTGFLAVLRKPFDAETLIGVLQAGRRRLLADCD